MPSQPSRPEPQSDCSTKANRIGVIGRCDSEGMRLFGRSKGGLKDTLPDWPRFHQTFIVGPGFHREGAPRIGVIQGAGVALVMCWRNPRWAFVYGRLGWVQS